MESVDLRTFSMLLAKPVFNASMYFCLESGGSQRRYILKMTKKLTNIKKFSVEIGYVVFDDYDIEYCLL